jgi:hypothetical protein
MNCNLPVCLTTLVYICFQQVATLFFSLGPATVSAQVFEAKTGVKEIATGSTFEVSFSLKDAQGERFKAPDLKDFKVVGGPSEMRGMSIINGKTSAHHTWSFELEPRGAGTFVIGAASVTANGKTLTTKPVTIKVVPASTQPNVNLPPGTADNLFITGELDEKRAYPGQQVTWRIRLYTQLALEGADLIELPDFKGFYSKEKRRFDTRLTYQTIRGKKYAVKTLHEEALFPQETGRLVIGPAKVRVGIEQPGAFGAFLGPKPVMLQTQPVQLEVPPLPTPVPEHFSGGVGSYDWDVRLDRDSLTTDDAIVLTIAVRGNGDARRFAGPYLALPTGLESFDPKTNEEEEYENGEEVVHSKVLEYVILPKQPGMYAVAPELIVFDPDSNRFYTLKADTLPQLRVTAGKNYGATPPGIDTLPPPVATPEKIWSEKIPDWLRSPVWWIVSVSLLLLTALFAWWKRRKKNTPAAPAPVRAARAGRDRFYQAGRLLNNGNPRGFYDELFKALQGYLSNRYALATAQMTQENVRKLLAERNVPSGTIQNLLTVWQTCEQALFAGQTQAAQMETTWRMAESVVQELERTKG